MLSLYLICMYILDVNQYSVLAHIPLNIYLLPIHEIFNKYPAINL